MIHFRCPACQAALKVDNAALGKTIRCPKCKNRVIVPQSLGGLEPLSPLQPVIQDAEIYAETPPAKQREREPQLPVAQVIHNQLPDIWDEDDEPAHKSNTLLLSLLITSLAAVVPLGIILAIVLSSKKPETETTLAKAVQTKKEVIRQAVPEKVERAEKSKLPPAPVQKIKPQEKPPNQPIPEAVAPAPLPLLPANPKPDVRKQPEVDPVIAAQVRDLVQQLQSRKTKDRVEAAQLLGRLKEQAVGASGALCQAAIDPAPSVAVAALEALEGVNPEVYRPVLVLIRDTEWGNHQAASAQLVSLGESGVVAIPIIRAHLLSLIAGQLVSVAKTFDILLALLIADIDAISELAPDDPIILKALLELSVYSTPTSQPSKTKQSIKQRSRIPETNLRLPFIQRLGDYGYKNIESRRKVVAGLMPSLRDSKPLVVVAAIEAVGKLGPDARSAVPTLKRLKLSNEAAIREAADRALQSIDLQ